MNIEIRMSVQQKSITVQGCTVYSQAQAEKLIEAIKTQIKLIWPPEPKK